MLQRKNILNIQIDYQSRIPIYEQIVLEVEKLVALGILVSNEQIPAIRELAYNLGINPNTVKKAYDTLEKHGVIISKSTKGTYITDNIDIVKNRLINNIIDDIKSKIGELENLGVKKEEIKKKIDV